MEARQVRHRVFAAGAPFIVARVLKVVSMSLEALHKEVACLYPQCIQFLSRRHPYNANRSTRGIVGIVSHDVTPLFAAPLPLPKRRAVLSNSQSQLRGSRKPWVVLFPFLSEEFSHFTLEYCLTFRIHDLVTINFIHLRLVFPSTHFVGTDGFLRVPYSRFLRVLGVYRMVTPITHGFRVCAN